MRIICSGSFAIFIVLHGRWDQFEEALTSPSFYLALTFSFSIAYLLMTLVSKITRLLNRKLPWEGKSYLRVTFQLIFGIVLPALLDVLIVSIYFTWTGQDFFRSGFLLFDFPVIVFFLVLINVYYLIVFPLLVNLQTANNTESAAAIPPSILVIHYNGNHIHLNVREDLLYCCRMGKRVTVYTKSGGAYDVNQTLGNLIENFQSAGLYQINRSLLINKDVIKGYTRGTRRDTLQLVIKHIYRDIPAMKDISLFVVTKEHLKDWKNYLQNTEIP